MPLYCLDVRAFAKDVDAYLQRWRPDVVLGSPDCRGFTVLTYKANWELRGRRRVPKPGSVAEMGRELVQAFLSIVEQLKPRYWVMENPRAMMRTLPELRGLERAPSPTVPMG